MIDDLVTDAFNASRDAKADSAQRGEKVMMPTLIVYRGDEQVAIVAAHVENSQQLAQAARMCVVGFAADVLVMAMDSFHAFTPENPLTGKPWEENEMQLVADKHHGIERGWVSDAVAIVAVNRADDVVAEILPYKKLSRHRVEFDDNAESMRARMAEAQRNGEHTEQGGRIVDALRAYMAEPPLTLQMAKVGLNGADFGLDQERSRVHEDLAVADVLTAAGHTVMLVGGEADSARTEVLKARRDRGGGIEVKL